MAKHNVERMELVGVHPSGSGMITLGHVVLPEGSLLLTPATASEFQVTEREAVIPYLMDCLATIAKSRWKPIAGPGSTHTDAVRRGAIASRSCPKCGAKAGAPCRRRNDDTRTSVHRERMT